ncbi:NAD(P)-dependent oxidoreductase [Bacillus marinisedimentorum]|uniref:NAD(P)-dependent oxidoreductase n=1 Tax=Bacillus marinisedimentorum TaxID=1821260 RepID=UPI000871EF04|nr:SDR family oxidoreductase [Bacillus marinisedimentorum]
MNICLFGATGRVGRKIMNLVIEDGHKVTALIRDPANFSFRHEQLKIIKGDAMSAAAVRKAVHGNDAVISSLSTGNTTTLSDSMPSIINAMEEEGIKRIVTIGTAGILDSRIESGKLRYQTSESRRKSTAAAEEHEKAYSILKKSRLDWTVACPTYLPEGPSTGKYRVEKNLLPIGGVKISTGDTAAFTYNELAEKKFLCSRAGLAY